MFKFLVLNVPSIDRPEMYAENNHAYADNGERFSFFSAACLDMLLNLAFSPISFMPMIGTRVLFPSCLSLLSTTSTFKNTRSVISIHNVFLKARVFHEELQSLPEMHSHNVPEAAVSDTHVTMLKAQSQKIMRWMQLAHPITRAERRKP